MLLAVVLGSLAGFFLRSVIAPVDKPIVGFRSAPLAVVPSSARGKPYFEANLDQARRVVAECRDGSVRGDECANAEQAVTEAEGQARFKKFMGY